jgi:hypothetical protein
VLNLWLMILVIAAGLIVLLWATTLFLQSYIYTEPTPGLAWQAPAAGAAIALFYALWCVIVANSADARPEDIPYDTLFRFSPTVDMVKEPVKELWAVKKNEEKVKYVRFRSADPLRPNAVEYRDTTVDRRPWRSSGVKAIELTHDGKKHRFEPAESESGAYPRYTSGEGWTMVVFDTGPTGIPQVRRLGRLFANLGLNFLHLVVWFACLWLLLRYQWSHALGLALAAWLLVTLAMLPMMLDTAARVAQQRAPVPTADAKPGDVAEFARIPPPSGILANSATL